MLEKSMGLLFFLKKPKNYSNGGLKDVYLKITIDGIPRELSSKQAGIPVLACPAYRSNTPAQLPLRFPFYPSLFLFQDIFKP